MIELNKIYCGECLDIMKDIDDNIIDLTVTSPPYDNLRSYNGYIFNFENIASELYRITKKGGIVVWIVGDKVLNRNESGTSFKQALFFKSIGFSMQTMIYQKSNLRYPSNGVYNRNFEYMFIFINGNKPKTFNQIKDKLNKQYGRISSSGSTRRKYNGELVRCKNIYEIPKYSKRGNIWEYTTGLGHTTKDMYAYKHPAMFPEKLVYDHIISWSNKGDLIFDPMCGAGTTCKIAKQLNRNFIGIDISQEYCEIANRRTK